MAKFKALVVGIDDYPPPNQLPSCVNDANAMNGLLQTMGFAVKMLVNDGATKAAVSDELRELFQDVKPDDRLVFYFSGHGFTDKKAGIFEEYLVLIDALFEDDLLAQLTQGVSPGTLTMIIDSCFSGGMEKYVVLEEEDKPVVEAAKIKSWKPTDADIKAFKVPAPAAAKGAPPPISERVKIRKFGLTEKASQKLFHRELERSQAADPLSKSFGMSKAAGSDEVAQTQTKGLLISACLETETAAASTSMTEEKSAFTFAMLAAVQSLGIQQSTTAIFERAAAILKPNFRQTPLIIAPTAMPKLAAASFLKLEHTAGAIAPPIPGQGAAAGEIDPKILVDGLAALIRILLEARPKSTLPMCWPPRFPLMGAADDPLGTFKGDDSSKFLADLIQILMRTVLQRPG